MYVFCDAIELDIFRGYVNVSINHINENMWMIIKSK